MQKKALEDVERTKELVVSEFESEVARVRLEFEAVC